MRKNKIVLLLLHIRRLFESVIVIPTRPEKKFLWNTSHVFNDFYSHFITAGTFTLFDNKNALKVKLEGFNGHNLGTLHR